MRDASSMSLTRTPPAAVLDVLRSEVNYGCPVADCGSPFLTWHHFDPPWRETKHHDASGMVALCSEHARIADNDMYTKDQLRAFKLAPFVKDRLQYQWPWTTEQLLVVLGRVVLIGPRPVIALGGRNLVTFERGALPNVSQPIVYVGVDLPDATGATIVTMKENWLDVDVRQLESMEVPPGTRDLHLKHSSGVELDLHLKRYPPSEFDHLIDELLEGAVQRADTKALARRVAADSEGKLPVLRVRGHFFSNDIKLDVTASKVEFSVKPYGNERVTLGQHVFTGDGKLMIKIGDREIIRFG